MADVENGSIQPLEGKTTIDDKMTFEPERLSYKAAARVAAWIAERIRGDIKDKLVVIAGDRLLTDLAHLSAGALQLDMLASDFEAAKTLVAPELAAAEATEFTASFVPPAAVALAGLQSALGLIGMFRQDVEFKGTVTKVDARAFEVSLASELKRNGARMVFVPELTVLTSVVSGEKSLTARWKKVQEERQAAWRVAGPLIADLARKEADLDETTQSGNAAQVAALSRAVFQRRRDLEPVTELLGGADRRLSELQAQWNKADETSGVTLLARLLRAEALNAMTPIYVHGAIVSSGGHNRVSRNLFRMLFFGDGLSSMGGVVARWAILEGNGSLADGGIRTAREGARFPVQVFDDELGF